MLIIPIVPFSALVIRWALAGRALWTTWCTPWSPGRWAWPASVTAGAGHPPSWLRGSNSLSHIPQKISRKSRCCNTRIVRRLPALTLFFYTNLQIFSFFAQNKYSYFCTRLSPKNGLYLHNFTAVWGNIFAPSSLSLSSTTVTFSSLTVTFSSTTVTEQAVLYHLNNVNKYLWTMFVRLLSIYLHIISLYEDSSECVL